MKDKYKEFRRVLNTNLLNSPGLLLSIADHFGLYKNYTLDEDRWWELIKKNLRSAKDE
jgi:hypothetical protein